MMDGDGRQLHLFGEPEPSPSKQPPGGVGPAAVPEDLVAVAGALPPSVRLGTSSWSFPGWAGLVYDRQVTPALLARRGLVAYGQHPLLRTVSVDRTFYAPIPVEAFAEYAASVHDDFRFLVKAPADCTMPRARGENGRSAGDNDLYLHPAFAVDAVVGPFVEGLGAKAGALVFQFPPQGSAVVRQPERFAARLGAFLDALPSGPAYAVELRDRELLGTDYTKMLHAVGAGHCASVHPRMPPPGAQLRVVGPASRGPLVVRWMLGAGLGYDEAKQRYAPFDTLVDEDRVTRAAIAGLVCDAVLGKRDVIVTANNKAEGSAPRTVFALAREIAARMEAAGG